MRTNKLYKYCEYCKKEYGTLNNRQRYCSRSCASIVKNKNKRIIYEFKCPKCNKKFKTVDKRSKFCSRECAASFNNKGRILTLEHKNKVSESLKKHYKNNPKRKIPHDLSVKNGAHSQKGKHKNPVSICDLSKRTITKIFKRLDVGCCVCGWNDDICDIHHIEGRKIKDCHNHKNLTYVCPNHHRLAQRGKLKKENLITLDIYIEDKWKDVYYG